MRSVLSMDDEELMCHLEQLHPGDLKLKFQAAPGEARRSLAAPELWRTYHDTLHRLSPNNYEHTHEVHMEKFDHDVKWADKDEDIWVMVRVGDGNNVADAFVSEAAARKAEERGDYSWGVEAVKTKLHRPALKPIYGGPTLLEALWNEMDRLMEQLMQPAGADDPNDRWRAEELAWVLAVVSNPYDPSVDRIRAEAMARWNAAEVEADAQERALDPDPDARLEGADQ